MSYLTCSLCVHLVRPENTENEEEYWSEDDADQDEGDKEAEDERHESEDGGDGEDQYGNSSGFDDEDSDKRHADCIQKLDPLLTEFDNHMRGRRKLQDSPLYARCFRQWEDKNPFLGYMSTNTKASNGLWGGLNYPDAVQAMYDDDGADGMRLHPNKPLDV